MDDEHLISIQQFLPFLKEEIVDEHYSIHLEKHTAQESIHKQSIPQDRVQVSMMTQTEYNLIDRSTSIDADFIQLFNLNMQTNENILSSIANPYHHDLSTSYSSEITTNIRNGISYINRSVSTGDDYPQWWVQLSTNIILSDHITNQGEEKMKIISLPSPRQQQDQSIQTINEQELEIDLEKSRRSPRTQKSSSSVTISNHYEVIDDVDDGNNSRRSFPFSNLSDNQIETSSNHTYSILRQTRPSSKQSDSDYHTLSYNNNQQSYSTPDHQNVQRSSYCSSVATNHRTRTKSSTSVLSNLFERYERTLRDRQRAIAIVNDELLDVNNLVNYYRQKLQNSISIESDKVKFLIFISSFFLFLFFLVN
jgi:hypothetical protein